MVSQLQWKLPMFTERHQMGSLLQFSVFPCVSSFHLLCALWVLSYDPVSREILPPSFHFNHSIFSLLLGAIVGSLVATPEFDYFPAVTLAIKKIYLTKIREPRRVNWLDGNSPTPLRCSVTNYPSTILGTHLSIPFFFSGISLSTVP